MSEFFLQALHNAFFAFLLDRLSRETLLTNGHMPMFLFRFVARVFPFGIVNGLDARYSTTQLCRYVFLPPCLSRDEFTAVLCV